MNTPPQSESGPSCSGSVASLKEMDKSMAKQSAEDGRHPPTPPLDGHPTFFLGPVDDKLRECGTVPEENEDDDVAVVDCDFQSSIASSNEGSWNDAAVEVTPATPQLAATGSQTPQPSAPSLKRRTSSRLNILLRRGHTSSDQLPALATAPALPSRRSFQLFSRNSRTPTSPVLHPESGTTTPQALAPTAQPENSPSPATPTSPAFLKGPRGKRSSSMTGLSKILGSNQISHPAPAGAGLKARKITSVDGEFPDIEALQLSSKYSNHSSVPLKKKQVGEGATAIVTLVHMSNGPPDVVYAVKEFRKKGSKEDELEYEDKVKSEFFVSKSLRHPNIVQTEDLCLKYGRWCHVMEYCSGGDLFGLIQKGFMKDPEKLCCFKQLLRGVSYLHAHGIAHRDIKPENLLMASDGHLKITDFGVSEIFSGKHPGVANIKCGVDMGEVRRCTPGICGSVPYLSPEVLAKKDDYDPRKLDVWSCAIVYITLHYGGAPWNKASEDDPMFSRYAFAWGKWTSRHPDGIIKSDEVDLPACRLMSDMKLGLRRLLFRMTHPDPAKRASIEEVLKDRYITAIECCTFDDEYQLGKNLDASKSDACKTATKLNVKRLHNHLPPKHS